MVWKMCRLAHAESLPQAAVQYSGVQWGPQWFRNIKRICRSGSCKVKRSQEEVGSCVGTTVEITTTIWLVWLLPLLPQLVLCLVQCQLGPIVDHSLGGWQYANTYYGVNSCISYNTVMNKRTLIIIKKNQCNTGVINVSVSLKNTINGVGRLERPK